MNGIVVLVTTLVLIALIAAVLVIVALLVRVRMIGRIVGTFECWTRPDTSSGWVSGMARFGKEEFQWFRLVGLAYGPQYRFPRRTSTVSAPLSRNTGEVVEVVLSSGDQRIYLALKPQWYNGLVAWLESGAPLANIVFRDDPNTDDQ
ncbi:MAG: DUF2550 family protein [Actinomycetaceae bacterium]|nr:DUF2550 family protein [Actinomycetaceae bacterium]